MIQQRFFSGSRIHNNISGVRISIDLPMNDNLIRQGLAELEPIPFRGSADTVAAAWADALAIVPAGGEVEPGEIIDYRPLSGLGS